MKKPYFSMIGTVICGSITAFFLLMAFSPLSAGDALVPMFTLLFAFLSGLGFLVFFLTWVVKKRKYEKEKSHREMMARRRVEKWRREQERKNDHWVLFWVGSDLCSPMEQIFRSSNHSRTPPAG